MYDRVHISPCQTLAFVFFFMVHMNMTDRKVVRRGEAHGVFQKRHTKSIMMYLLKRGKNEDT